MDDLKRRVSSLGRWYHRIDLGSGVVTPGIKDQSLTFGLYESRLPADLNGLQVLDLGANAAGLSVEFARRGASVTAVESGKSYVEQARLVITHLELEDRVTVTSLDMYQILDLGAFDIVCCVGLLYHLRHFQLGLDLVHHAVKPGGHALISSQTMQGTGPTMRARHAISGSGQIMGWEPTESILAEMIAKAGFASVQLVSSAPHAGESEGRVLGNRSYYLGRGTADKKPLPFISEVPVVR